MRRRPGSVRGCSPSTGSPEAWASRWRSVAPAGPAGSSRSTVPSSSATRSARPVRSFVTDAHGTSAWRGPCVATTPSACTTPAAATPALQPSIARSASTGPSVGSPRMRLATLAGLYVAVVLSAQVGANKIVRLPFTHLEAPGGVYSIGVALALVQLAHHSGVTRREGALNAQLMIGAGFVGSAVLAAYIAIVVHSHPAFPGQPFDRAVGSTWRIVGASLVAFIVSETVDNLV